jgi:hypothetical protein
MTILRDCPDWSFDGGLCALTWTAARSNSSVPAVPSKGLRRVTKCRSGPAPRSSALG